MTRWQRRLVLLLVVELVVTAGWIKWRLDGSHPPPPRPDVGFLDRVTADEIRQFEAAAVGGEPADWQRLAEIYTVSGFFPEAEYSARVAVRLEPTSFNHHFWLGMIEDRLGRTDLAIESFEAALEVAPARHAPRVWHLLGRIHLRDENPVRAEEAFRNSGELVMARYELARLLVREGRADQAIPVLDALLGEYPDSYQLHYWRARAAGAVGDESTARREDDLAGRTQRPLPTDLVAERLLAEADRFGLRRRVADARRLAEAAGGLPAAIRSLEAVLEIDRRPEVIRLLARWQIEGGHPAEAGRLVSELIETEPARPLDWLLIGDGQAAAGDEPAARESWNRSIRLRPTAAAHRWLAGNNVAGSHAARAWFYEGIEHFRHNRIDEARMALKRSVEVDADRAPAWFYLGECDRVQERNESARKRYRRCLQLEPTHGRAIAALRRIGSAT